MTELRFKKVDTCLDCGSTDLDSGWCHYCHNNVKLKAYILKQLSKVVI